MSRSHAATAGDRGLGYGVRRIHATALGPVVDVVPREAWRGRWRQKMRDAREFPKANEPIKCALLPMGKVAVRER